MAWGVGANDVANAMGTSVGAGALTIKQAILIAMVFEFAGAYLAGGEVTSTIRKGIIDPAILEGTPELLVYGMLSALLAAGTWLLIASMMGWPVSTTHSIVGAIVGFAAVGISPEAVHWGKVGKIVASWVVSPVLAGTIAYMLFSSVQKLILTRDDPFSRAKKIIPIYMFAMIFTACAMAFAHGSNDVANAVGPLAAVVSVVKSGAVGAKSMMPSWILLLGGVGIMLGLATYGFKVMGTIGRKITELTPSRGFAAELGAAATVVLASGIGLPISTTHTLVGAVLGVGLARGIAALNMRVIGTIFMSWLITLPAGAGLAIVFFFFFKGIFS
ncbi:UNVERIFIED_CONTAM: hypothetical protein GTU68_014870 [Idotea baltica]|nr:hypothetical protein [Idotea baltica]